LNEEERPDFLQKRMIIQIPLTDVVKNLKLFSPQLHKRLMVDEELDVIPVETGVPLASIGRVVAVESGHTFSPDGTINKEKDKRWNYGHLREAIHKSVPTSTHLATGVASFDQEYKLHVAWPIVIAFSVLCASFGVIPLPILDTIPITLSQGAMLATIKALAITGRQNLSL
jgi:hypothetical protein